MKKKRIIQLTAWFLVLSVLGGYSFHVYNKFYVYDLEVAKYHLFINDYDAVAMANSNQKVYEVLYPESPFELNLQVAPLGLKEAASNQLVVQLAPPNQAYLTASLHINPKSAGVSALAATLYQNESDSQKKIQRTLNHFKHFYKLQKQFGVYEKRFAAYESFDPMDTGTDEEIIVSKEGTQIELATLFVSLMRSQGIPAKLVGGHIFALNEGGFKVWTEVYLPEYGWIPIDPTHHRIGVDNRYIKLKEGVDWADFGESLVEMHVGVERLNW